MGAAAASVVAAGVAGPGDAGSAATVIATELTTEGLSRSFI